MDKWMNNPKVKNMDPLKLELIKMAAIQTKGKNGRALAPVMMSLITGANQRGIRFTPEEMNLILALLKEGKSDTEKAQIDQMVKMIRGYMK